MPDYVDREAVLREITETAVVNFCEDDAWYQEIMEAVKAIPAANVVEVVRCCDCIHGMLDQWSAGEYVIICDLPKKHPGREAHELYWSCPHGQRKEV